MIKLIETKETNGQIFKCYELKNLNGASAQIINFGAIIHRLIMPDVNGDFVEILAGFDEIDGYYLNPDQNFNAAIGRVANRIADSKFVLNGKTYNLYPNNNGNCLHGGKEGFNRKFWDTEIVNVDGVEKLQCTYASVDGEENFPSNLTVKILYSLTEDNALCLEYFAQSDGDTHCNLTNHAYFNLSGFKNDILDHVVSIKSNEITAINELLIPNGELYKVENTSLDFNMPKTVGKDILADNKFLKIGGGYDFNYVLSDNSGVVATAFSPLTRIFMEVYTTEPCMQLYTGNFLNGLVGRKIYNKQTAFCFETQRYPNACNVPSFPSTLLKKGETYQSKTIYKFSVIK